MVKSNNNKGAFMRTRGLAFLLLSTVVLLSGCAHYTSPKSMPGVDLKAVGAFSRSFSVDLINNQPDASQQIYGGIGGHTYYANYNEWTQFLVDHLGAELNKRGASVSSESLMKLKIKLSDFALIQGMWVVRINMKVALEIPGKNWKKEWVVTDTSGWSGGRAMGSTLYRIIEKIMQDPEIMDLLQPKQ